MSGATSACVGAYLARGVAGVPLRGPARPVIDTLLFDLDGTLYPVECGYQDAFRENLYRFIYDELQLPRELDAKAEFKKMFAKYNQALRALRAPDAPWPIKDFDVDAFYRAFRAGADKYLTVDPEVVQALRSLKGYRKYVFTNTHEQCARDCLPLLGLDEEGLFDGIVGCKQMGTVCKPEPEAFSIALAACGRADAPSRCAFFEDSFKNLKTAKALGITTVFIVSDTAEEEGVQRATYEQTCDACLPKITVATLQERCPFLTLDTSTGGAAAAL